MPIEISAEEMKELFALMRPLIDDHLALTKPWRDNVLIPSMDVYRVDPKSKFMEYSTCSSKDFFHPEYARISKLIDVPEVFHRKYWEWVYIVHHAFATSSVGPNKRALAFGVGQEALPAVFAGAGTAVVATDAPETVAKLGGWIQGEQFARNLAAMPNPGISRETFENLVQWRECDMNAISPEFTDFDFCWSACCLEHLGSLQAGIDFIVASVEKTLKVGGVAVHTTEFNLSSNVNTIETGPAVIYRLQDINRLISTLKDRGHHVDTFRVAPNSLVIDGYVDTPPYHAPPHLRLALDGFTSTSAGFVIRRGR